MKDTHPAELGAVAVRAALRARRGPADAVDEVLIGHGRQAGSGPNPARQVGHRAGLPVTAPAQTINKACASGLQAIASGAQSILLGESAVVVAGGIESMSRMPYLVDAADARWGHKMGHFQFVDAMYRDGFSCPLSGLIMGETAEILARQYGITRAESDAFALESQRKAEAAQRRGPLRRRDRAGRGDRAREDRHAARRRASPARLHARGAREAAARRSRSSKDSPASSPPARRRASPTAARPWCSRSAAWASAHGVTPLARLLGWASAGVDPRVMGIGPVPALREAAGPHRRSPSTTSTWSS